MIEFKGFPKIHRYSRNVVVTEKLDGTNAAVIIHEGKLVGTQSRSRLITPEDDNYGFARWAQDNKDMVESTLGIHDGHHFGEWWGQGIQRNYGMNRKIFSLFNVARWGHLKDDIDQISCVPTIWTGAMDELNPQMILNNLWLTGSVAAPGFRNPEGIVIFHENSYATFKKTFEKDDEGKGYGA